METPQAQYTKTPKGDGYVFHVTPAPAPRSTFLLFVVGIPSFVVISGALSSGNPILILIGGVLAWFAIRWALSDRRPKNHHTPSTFIVTPNYVDVNGQRFEKDDIHAIVKQNIYHDNAPNYAYVNSNQQMGLAVREQAARVSYALNLESAGKAHQLAGGMDDTTARGLQTDVSRIIGFS